MMILVPIKRYALSIFLSQVAFKLLSIFTTSWMGSKRTTNCTYISYIRVMLIPSNHNKCSVMISRWRINSLTVWMLNSIVICPMVIEALSILEVATYWITQNQRTLVELLLSTYLMVFKIMYIRHLHYVNPIQELKCLPQSISNHL